MSKPTITRADLPLVMLEAGRKVVQEISRITSIPTEDILRPGRGLAPVSVARQMAMHVLFYHLNWGTMDIAAYFGKGCHSTVVHANGKVKRDARLASQIANSAQIHRLVNQYKLPSPYTRDALKVKGRVRKKVKPMKQSLQQIVAAAKLEQNLKQKRYSQIVADLHLK